MILSSCGFFSHIWLFLIEAIKNSHHNFWREHVCWWEMENRAANYPSTLVSFFQPKALVLLRQTKVWKKQNCQTGLIFCSHIQEKRPNPQAQQSSGSPVGAGKRTLVDTPHFLLIPNHHVFRPGPIFVCVAWYFKVFFFSRTSGRSEPNLHFFRHSIFFTRHEKTVYPFCAWPSIRNNSF